MDDGLEEVVRVVGRRPGQPLPGQGVFRLLRPYLLEDSTRGNAVPLVERELAPEYVNLVVRIEDAG